MLESSGALACPRDELFTDPETLALSGFLAGYSGLTRDAYALDLRQFAAWVTRRRDASVRGPPGSHRSVRPRARGTRPPRATIARRLGTITCFYRYAEQEGLIEHSPAVHVRRPKLDYESHAVGLDRNELGAMLVAAGLAGARDHALISLLALNGLRVSEAIGARIEDLALERGHRTLTVLRKGGKTVVMPLAPRTARAVDLVVGERFEGADPATATTAVVSIATRAARIVRRIAKARRDQQARRTAHPAPRVHHRRARCRRPAPRRPRSRSPTPTRAPRCATTAPASHSTDTPPTSSPRSSPAPPAEPHPARYALETGAHQGIRSARRYLDYPKSTEM